jgi:predicted nucleotidyltransferase
LTENAVRKLESGSSKEPRFSTGLRLARVLGVPPDEIAGIAGESLTAGPDLARVIREVRAQKDALKKQRIEHLSIFGSVARGDARASSDIDIVLTPQSNAPFTLINLAAATQVLQSSLQRSVDVITIKTLESSPFGRKALDEAVSVF